MATPGPGGNKIKVQILGETYTLRGQESQEHLARVANLVDQMMRDVVRENPVLDQKRVAVLAAMNLADMLIKLQAEYDDLMALLEERT